MKPFVRRILFIALAVLTSQLASAMDSDFFVLVDPKKYPKKAFKSAPHLKVRELASKGIDIVDRGERERLFCRVAGLEKAVARFDELDKDLLFLRATEFDMATLNAAYVGRIAPTILKKLWQEAQEF